MVIPKVEFRYSGIYDMQIKEWTKPQRKKMKIKRYPSPKTVCKYIKEVKPLWKKHEKELLTEMARVVGLKWYFKEIDCFVAGAVMPFSWPLTMSSHMRPKDWFVDVLTHEMIHNILSRRGTEKAWKYFLNNYKNKTWNTKVHVPVHAVHKYLYLKFFDEKRFQREIRFSSKYKDYKKAWDIVEKEGYKNIIKEFKKRVKV